MESEVTLIIEDTPVMCKKQDLVENSDYFKAMFGGNFSESEQSTVTLQDIRISPMQRILGLLLDPTYVISELDLIPVLQTACILQFTNIREICVRRLTQSLTWRNCLEIWFVADLHNIRYLHLKAKNIALTDFSHIKDSKMLLDLTITQLRTYLANVVLNCDSEIDVFLAVMRWYDENSNGDTSKMKQLMHCIDFHSISLTDVGTMKMHASIADNIELTGLFGAIMHLKTKQETGKARKEIESVDKSLLELAEKFVNSKKRHQNRVDPVFFVRRGPPLGPKETVIEACFETFRQERKYVHVEGDTNNTSSLLILDMVKKRFIKCLDVPIDKVNGLEGFHILGVKDQIFLFGGENMLGSGHWNLNFWVYNTIKEDWELKTQMPSGRRHFMSCICGPYLYIIGGTGSFRIIQDNMYCYNYETNVWSKLIYLPCSARELVHCVVDEKLFLFNPTIGIALIFDNAKNQFLKLKIVEEDDVVPVFPMNFTLFSYHGKLYMKGCELTELVVEKHCVRMSTAKWLQPILQPSRFDCVDSILCNDILLTMYKCSTTDTATIEQFNMKTHEMSILEMPTSTVPNERYTFNYFTKWFTLSHHHILENDIYINDYEESNVL